MDILLINPDAPQAKQINEHIGIAGLKSYTNACGFKADILDMALESLSVHDCVRNILELQPKMVGLSLLDANKQTGFRIIHQLDAAGYEGKIVLGGYFPTFSSREILRDFPRVDFIVRGEGELTLVDLIKHIYAPESIPLNRILGLSYRMGNEIFENQARPLIENLDILPPVDRKYAHQLLGQKAYLRINGTRGCWGSCSFCDIIQLYRTSRGKVWRRRSVRHLVDEIESLVSTYQTNHFIFNDDQFLVKGPKAVEYADAFAGELEKRGLNIEFELMCRADTVKRPVMQRLKAVGLQRVFLGLESFDPSQLRRYNKNISVRQNLKAVITLYNLKIDVIASVILADAYTGLWDLLKQFVVLFELKRRYFNSRRCQISVNKKLEIYRGSAVYKEYKSKGLLTRNHYLEGYDFKLKSLTALRLNLLTAEENLVRFLIRPRTVLKQISTHLHWRLSAVKNLLL